MDSADRRPAGAGTTVRRAGPEDDPDLATLAHGHYGGDLATWRERMRRTPSRPDGCTFLAEHDGEVVGYGRAAWCQPRNDQDTAPAGLYLTGVVVAPAWRRRGIGEALTRARLAWARRRTGEVWMFTNARNEASLALHGRLGFVEVARAGSYLGEPFDGGAGVLMRAGPDRAPLRSEGLRLPQDTAAPVGRDG